MCTTPMFKTELRLEFNSKLNELNLLIIEAEKILKKKYKLKKVKK